MGNQKRQRHNHWLRNINRKRAISYGKYEKAMAWYLFLLEKKQKDSGYKWAKSTLPKAESRLKKYGITNEMIKQYAEKKGKSNLLT